MPDHILEVKNIHKTYARREVVNDVSFAVKVEKLLDCLGQMEQVRQPVFILFVVWLDLIREKFFLTTKVSGICRCINVPI